MQGVHAEEFTSLRRDGGLPDQIIPLSVTNRTQQVPVSAIYQLLQTHPELMVLKGNGNFEPAWELDERRAHLSMDCQESFNFYLTHGIEDGDIVDVRDTLSPDGGRGSPVARSSETIVFPVAENRSSKAGLKQNKDNSCLDKSLNPESESKFKSPTQRFQVQDADVTNGLEMIKNPSKEPQKDDKKDEYENIEEMGTSEKIPLNTENTTINTTKESTASRADVMNNKKEILSGEVKRLSDKETKGEKNRKIRTDQLSDITKVNQESDDKRVKQPFGAGINGDNQGRRNLLERQEGEPEETNAE
ncbi:uncharacterized protein [Penaeus vannamei]|uniref:uncharacterized protein n=1 Tax=Penaeus vannamei TaxID=6689 RepID=UPI00387FA32A